MSQGSEIYQALTPSHKCISHLMNWLRQSKLKARPLILIRCYIICFAKIIVNWMKWQLKAGEVSKSLVAIMQLRYLHLRHYHQPSVLQFERVSWQQWAPDQFLMGLWLSFGPVVSYLKSNLSCFRFGSSGCSIWTSYTSIESSWPADFDYLSFGSRCCAMTWDSWNWSCSLMVPFSAGHIFTARKFCKGTMFNYCCRKPAHLTLLCQFLTM